VIPDQEYTYILRQYISTIAKHRSMVSIEGTLRSILSNNIFILVQNVSIPIRQPTVGKTKTKGIFMAGDHRSGSLKQCENLFDPSYC
jgi:thioredoxin reductase